MKIKCLLCNDTIESKYTHNFVSCKCNNCYIDGGQDYLHFGGNDFSKILIILMMAQKYWQMMKKNIKRNMRNGKKINT